MGKITECSICVEGERPFIFKNKEKTKIRYQIQCPQCKCCGPLCPHPDEAIAHWGNLHLPSDLCGTCEQRYHGCHYEYYPGCGFYEEAIVEWA